MKGAVAKILLSSAVDGPGNRAVIFLQGCQFDCLYCHNPETIQIVKTQAEIDQKTKHVQFLDVQDIVSKIEKYENFISGVTISGGECTLQYDFLLELLTALKNKNIHVLLDTNGHINENRLAELVALADGFMLDIKATSDDSHKKLTGLTNQWVLNSAHAFAQANKLYEIRTVIVPDILENEETVLAVAKFIVAYKNKTRYKLIKYRAHGVRKEKVSMQSPTDAFMKTLAEKANNVGCENVIIV